MPFRGHLLAARVLCQQNLSAPSLVNNPILFMTFQNNWYEKCLYYRDIDDKINIVFVNCLRVKNQTSRLTIDNNFLVSVSDTTALSQNVSESWKIVSVNTIQFSEIVLQK